MCTPRFLPAGKLADADAVTERINPDNRPPDAHLGPSDGEDGQRLVVERRVYWGKEGVKLTVGFLDRPSKALRKRILAHMNAWNARGANIEFVESKVEPQVRIARFDHPPDMAGYWSYMGSIAKRPSRSSSARKAGPGARSRWSSGGICSTGSSTVSWRRSPPGPAPSRS